MCLNYLFLLCRNINYKVDLSVHPYIQKKLDEVRSWLIRKAPDCNGWFLSFGSSCYLK